MICDGYRQKAPEKALSQANEMIMLSLNAHRIHLAAPKKTRCRSYASAPPLAIAFAEQLS
jgi:hypothetical protein